MATMLSAAYKYLNSATLYAFSALGVSSQMPLKWCLESCLQVLESEALCSTVGEKKKKKIVQRQS